jgi:hypothetical protein
VGQFSKYNDYKTGEPKAHSRYFYLRTSYRIQIMGEDNADILADRP